MSNLMEQVIFIVLGVGIGGILTFTNPKWWYWGVMIAGSLIGYAVLIGMTGEKEIDYRIPIHDDTGKRISIAPRCKFTSADDSRSYLKTTEGVTGFCFVSLPNSYKQVLISVEATEYHPYQNSLYDLTTQDPIILTSIGELAQESATTTPSPTQTPVSPTDTSILATTTPTQTPVPPTATFIPPTATPSLRVGSSKVAEKDGMKQLYVPGGEFTMGSTQAEVDAAFAHCEAGLWGSIEGTDCKRSWYENEMPQHTVEVAEFWIDQTEVPNKMFAQCVAERGCTTPSKTSSYTNENYYGNPQFDAYPVIWVNWHQATAYCQWAGRRLPTEAEWEKAARGTDGRVYPWGDAFDGTKLNFCDTTCSLDWADKTADDGYADVAPVGSYPAGASPYGALNMAGNVLEWTASKYQPYLYDNVSQNNTEESEKRVMRGGSWFSTDNNERTANRTYDSPVPDNFNLGFRCSQ